MEEDNSFQNKIYLSSIECINDKLKHLLKLESYNNISYYIETIMRGEKVDYSKNTTNLNYLKLLGLSEQHLNSFRGQISMDFFTEDEFSIVDLISKKSFNSIKHLNNKFIMYFKNKYSFLDGQCAFEKVFNDLNEIGCLSDDRESDKAFLLLNALETIINECEKKEEKIKTKKSDNFTFI